MDQLASFSAVPLTRHAATDMSVIALGIDCIQFKVQSISWSHKPGVVDDDLNCGGRQYDRLNFTYVTLPCENVTDHKSHHRTNVVKSILQTHNES